MASQPAVTNLISHHSMERQQPVARTLHEQMMLIAEPIIQHNWTDVAIHDRDKLRTLPVGHTAYWIVTQMGSYLSPAYCRLSDRPKWTSGCLASLAPVQVLVARWMGEASKFQGSTPWRRFHDPYRDKHCFLVTKTDAKNGTVVPIPYMELAELAVCKTRPVVEWVEY
jgi:hypothetical protein